MTAEQEQGGNNHDATERAKLPVPDIVKSETCIVCAGVTFEACGQWGEPIHHELGMPSKPFAGYGTGEDARPQKNKAIC
jgi:hypothetical protein